MSGRLNKLIDVLVCLFAGSVLAWGITSGIISYIYQSPPYFQIFIYVILIMLTLRVIFYNKYTLITVSAVTAFALIFFINNLRTNPELTKMAHNAYNFMHRVILYIAGYEPYRQAYEIAVILMLCILVCAYIFIANLRRYGFFAIIILTAGAYFVILPSGFSYSLPFTGCMTGLFILLARYLNYKNKLYQATAFAAVILCVGISQILPVPEQGFAMSAVNKPLKAVNSFITELFSPKYFTLSSSGYMRSDNILGGDIFLTDDAVMQVSVKASGRLYLAGAYKNNYTGYSWENTLPENSPYLLDDSSTELLERMFSNILVSMEIGEFEALTMGLADSSLFLHNPHSRRTEYIESGVLTIQMQKSLYNVHEAEINMLNSKTFTVFTHGLPVGVSLPGLLLKDGTDNLSTSKLINKNSPYTLYYRNNPMNVEFNSIEFLSRRGVYNEIYEELQILHEKYNFDKRQLTALLDESMDEEPYNMHMIKIYPPGEAYFNADISVIYEDFLTDVLIPRADDIYRIYTALPENLPKRVADLAIELTEDKENDIIKAMELRRFLRSYPYTLTPGDVPEGRDFVDYFLFDGQEGYCTYFASAFVILCRAAGIPARYVEGYVTPTKKDENGLYIVTNKNGHAWAEIYLEGYGWNRFEPTPPQDSRGQPVRLPAAENYNLRDDNTGEIITLGLLGESFNFNTEPSKISITQEIFQDDNQNINILNILYINLVVAVILVLYAFILYILLLYLYKHASMKKISGKDNNDAAADYFKIMLNYLRLFDCEKSPHETIIQFAGRIAGSFEDIPLNRAAAIFTSACYGNARISTDDVNIIKSVLDSLDAKLIKLKGRVKYLLMKIK